MIKFTKSDEVDYVSYEEALNRKGYVYVDEEEARLTLDYLKSRYETLANRAIYVMKLRSGGRFYMLDRNSIYGYLTQCEMCPEHYFYTKKSEKFSLDMNKVLSRLYANGRATMFLSEYMAHRSAKSKYGSLRTLVEACVNPTAVDHAGKNLCKVGFTAVVQQNLRFNYSQFDIISQIPKDVTSIISAEKGYFLAWGDFAQSDFRIAYNLFIRSEENDAIMDKYEDKYEALARIVADRLGKKFDKQGFQEERQLYKMLTLSTVYGKRSSMVPQEQQFIEMFAKFLMTCPRYAEYYQRLDDYKVMRSPIAVKSYFGYEQFVYYDSYAEQKQLYEALNKPIQTGTSEIVILTVNSVLEKARECGLTEDQFDIYLTRHDEPVFRIREDAMEYIWILQEHSTVLVDDWSPLQMDFSFGYHYKVQDSELQERAAEALRRNAHRITNIRLGSNRMEDYYPLKPLLLLDFYSIPIPEAGVSIVTVMEEKSGAAIFSIYETTEPEQVINNFRLHLKSVEARIREQFSGIFVRNNNFRCEDYFGNTHVVYQQEVSAAMNKAIQLCRGMTNMYCTKAGIRPPDGCDTPLTEFPPKLSVLVREQSGDMSRPF